MDFTTFIMTLLSGDWLFFDEGEITWDGRHHHITGIQVNGAQVSQFMTFVNSEIDGFDDIQEVVNYFIGFLEKAEEDPGLIVPRKAIAPGIQKALRDGDLTGITLANLAACGGALQVHQRDDRNLYVVVYDTRLAKGIPAFFDLVKRLIWDFRQVSRSQMGVPFAVTFAGARNIDADAFLSDVPANVPGAQENPGPSMVEKCPEVRIRNRTSGFAREARGPLGSHAASFCPGIDDPTPMQADEELFEACLASLARSFPLTVAIEGTHALGRADRIEKVRAGDKLVLATDWQTEFFDPVGIEVFNEKGETLGYLNEQFSPAMSGNRELACLIPFITASVAAVTPLSQRGKNARHALMDIRLDLDESLVPGPWAAIDPNALVGMKLLLAKPKSRRSTISQSNLQLSQLKGAINGQAEVDTGAKHVERASSAGSQSQPPTTQSARETHMQVEYMTPEKATHLQRLESTLAGEVLEVYNIIAFMGGAVDLMDIGEQLSSYRDPLSLYRFSVTSLLRDGLLVERVEPAPLADETTRCKRFYTWRQVDQNGQPLWNWQVYQQWLFSRLESFSHAGELMSLRNACAAMKAELKHCGFFEKEKKRVLKGRIAGVEGRISLLSSESMRYATKTRDLNRRLNVLTVWLQSGGGR